MCYADSYPETSLDPSLSPKYVAPRSVKRIATVSRLNQNVLNPGAKRLEIGYLNAINHLTVYILSECFPVWLLSLDATWCLNLYLVGSTSLDSFLLPFSPGLREMALLLLAPFIQRKILSFCSKHDLISLMSGQLDALLLLSGGTFEFLVPLIEQFQEFKLCGVCDSHFAGRLRKGRPTANDAGISKRLDSIQNLTWHRCRHPIVGGSTEFVALFVHNQIVVSPPVSRIQRGIQHVFVHSIRPGPPPKELPADRSGRHYNLDDRLIPVLYHLPVLCLSPFHSTGWGYRV